MNKSVKKRRRHRKSRSGCIACKRRKTKCSETLPECEKCFRQGTSCVYPHPAANRGLLERVDRTLLPALTARSQLEGRYFHHFLTIAYPFLPAGNDRVWQIHLLQLTMQNAHVQSALFGLSAVHLACLRPTQQDQIWAVLYRGHALAGLKYALSSTKWTQPHVDSAIALVYLLGFQSQYMEDGLFDFMTMVQGIVMVSRYVAQTGRDTSFHLDETATSTSVPEAVVTALPQLDLNCLDTGLMALCLLVPVLQTEEQMHLFVSIRSVFEAALDSTWLGFEEYWNMLNTVTPKSFISSDVVIKTLQTFLVTLRLLMDPITIHVFCPAQKTFGTRQEVRRITITWARRIFESLPREMNQYVEWPRAVVECARLKLRTLKT